MKWPIWAALIARIERNSKCTAAVIFIVSLSLSSASVALDLIWYWHQRSSQDNSILSTGLYMETVIWLAALLSKESCYIHPLFCSYRSFYTIILSNKFSPFSLRSWFSLNKVRVDSLQAIRSLKSLLQHLYPVYKVSFHFKLFPYLKVRNAQWPTTSQPLLPR